jgi:small-conductance mechanosensitive channel
MAVFMPDKSPPADPSQKFQMESILYYAILVGLWITAATFLNTLLRIFFWDRMFARSVKGQVPQLLIDVVSVLIYIIAITIIIGGVFKQPLTGFWATSGVVVLIIGLALEI